MLFILPRSNQKCLLLMRRPLRKPWVAMSLNSLRFCNIAPPTQRSPFSSPCTRVSGRRSSVGAAARAFALRCHPLFLYSPRRWCCCRCTSLRRFSMRTRFCGCGEALLHALCSSIRFCSCGGKALLRLSSSFVLLSQFAPLLSAHPILWLRSFDASSLPLLLLLQLLRPDSRPLLSDAGTQAFEI